MNARTMVAGGVLSLLSIACIRAAEPTSAPADDAAKYAEVAAKRAEDAVAAAKIDDAGKADKAKAVVARFYTDLHDWDAARDEQLKAVKKGSPEAKAVADAEQAKKVDRVKELTASLAADLTPEQVEAIKDKIVYNVRQVTYNAYLDEIPKLTEEQKKYIADTLLEARELALTGGSSKEKHGWFDKYKGRINNYLAKQGYDMKAENAAWAERRKAAAATQKHPD